MPYQNVKTAILEVLSETDPQKQSVLLQRFVESPAVQELAAVEARLNHHQLSMWGCR